MALPIEDAPIVLQGPRPELPPGFWPAYGWIVALALALGLVIGWLLWRLGRRAARPVDPLARLETALRAAEILPAAESVAPATQALRAYLASVDARAATSLSTEELLATLGGLPVFLPAHRTLGEALRAADAAKFAGASLDPAQLLADAREAVRRIEAARRAFDHAPIAPLVGPPRSPSNPAPAGPPPLPRRDLA
jgi:hypothetical protein